MQSANERRSEQVDTESYRGQQFSAGAHKCKELTSDSGTASESYSAGTRTLSNQCRGAEKGTHHGPFQEGV